MKSGAPLATLVHQHVRPMTGKFLPSGVGLPTTIGVAKVAFLLGSLHCYLVTLDAALDKATEQRLGPLLSSNLLAPGRKNNGGFGVALATLDASPELNALSHCEATAAAWLLKSWENAASAVSIPTTTNRHLTIGFCSLPHREVDFSPTCKTVQSAAGSALWVRSLGAPGARPGARLGYAREGPRAAWGQGRGRGAGGLGRITRD